MTAEIAIMNRAALAPSADSAVTIRMGNKVKIYDSVEKLFEFSRQRPIASMIYKNVKLVGLSLTRDLTARDIFHSSSSVQLTFG